jgi:hypothetical protein
VVVGEGGESTCRRGGSTGHVHQDVTASAAGDVVGDRLGALGRGEVRGDEVDGAVGVGGTVAGHRGDVGTCRP